MTLLGTIPVGGSNPVRIMGILNLSPESFFKKSVAMTKTQIKNAVQKMEQEGANFIDVGGMSTAPYLSTLISERAESERLLSAIKIIQNVSNLPISVDTCRSSVAEKVLNCGVEIINDISGLKYDLKMKKIIAKSNASLILCAYDKKIVSGNPMSVTRKLLRESIKIARQEDISPDRIVLDPAIGFFRQNGKGPFFTKSKFDWFERDLSILQDLSLLKQDFPIMISVSNKSFLGKLLGKEDPPDRIFGSIAAEVISIMNGADIIRTHNVSASQDALLVASKLSKQRKGL